MTTAQTAIAAKAREGRPFTCADLDDLGVMPPAHPAYWGSAFARAKAAGLIKVIGYTASRRPSRSGGVTRVWRGRHPVPKGTAR